MYTFVPTQHPTCPGVYLMHDERGRILYVGKAKNLRRRLSSYFRDPASLPPHTPKTRALLARVHDVQTMVTATEKEALLLEESLIKKHKPRYNILLRDDKKYIVFKLDKRHAFPRLVATRKIERDGSAYFGPFTSGLQARETLRAVHRAFPLRKCKDTVFRNRVRPCVYADIGRCLAPCVRQVDPAEYKRLVQRIELLFNGRPGELVARLEAEMRQASQELAFERAAELRDQISAIRNTVERQAVVLPGDVDRDVVATAQTSRGLGLGVLFIRGGRLIGQKSFFWPGMDLAEAPEAVTGFLTQFYGPGRLIPPRIILPWMPWAQEDDEAVAEVLTERRGAPVRLVVAKSATEKQLLELARQNAVEDAARVQDKPLGERLAARLDLAEPPIRLECVDISHLGGRQTRAGMVVFVDGEPQPDAYRVYSLPESEGSQDDYLALAEWAERRVASGPPWPDLVLVDGGRGQLAAVERALAEAGAPEDIELASIAKAGRSQNELGDVIFRPGRRNPMALKPGQPELLFLQRVRDTAHRFVLGRQRKARGRAALESELLSLPGVGPSTARLLWDRFGSLSAMAQADAADLAGLPGIGAKRAAQLAASLRRLAAASPTAQGPADDPETTENKASANPAEPDVAAEISDAEALRSAAKPDRA